MGLDCAIEYQRCDTSWRPRREKLDPKQTLEYPPAVRPLAKQVARVVLVSPWRRAGTFLCRARPGQGSQSCWPVRMIYSGGNRM